VCTLLGDSFGMRGLLSNSGTEAIRAIKAARLAGHARREGKVAAGALEGPYHGGRLGRCPLTGRRSIARD